MRGISSAAFGIGGQGLSTTAGTIGRVGVDQPNRRSRGMAGMVVPAQGLRVWVMGSPNGYAKTFNSQTASSGVVQWRDFSGNGNHLRQTNSSNRPTISAGAQNGKTALVFDGSNDYLVGSSTTAFDFGNNEYDVYIIVDIPNSGNKIILSTASAISPSVAGIAVMYMNKKIRGLLQTGSKQKTATTANSYNGKGYVYVRTYRNASQLKLEVDASDGTTDTITTASATGNVSGGAFSVGAENDGGNAGAVNVCEVLVYNRLLGTGEAAAVKQYLSGKYGLSL